MRHLPLAPCALFVLFVASSACASAQQAGGGVPAASPAPLATNAPAGAPASPAPSAPLAHPRPARPDAFIQFELASFEYVDNYLTNGVSAYGTPSVALGTRIPILGQTVLLDAEFHVESYFHPAKVVPTAGGGTVFIPSLTAREYTQDGRVAVLVAKPDIYVGLGAYYHATNYGFPELTALGFGVEKLPNFHRSASTFGRLYFYPNVNNEDPFFDTASGRPLGPRFSLLRYQGGGTLRISPIDGFLTYAVDGERFWRIVDTPSNDGRIELTLGYLLHIR